jgi:hypothetical protein
VSQKTGGALTGLLGSFRGWIGWGVTTFLDALTQGSDTDPVEFRLAHLDAVGQNTSSAPNSVGGAMRLAEVLTEVAERSGWGENCQRETGWAFPYRSSPRTSKANLDCLRGACCSCCPVEQDQPQNNLAALACATFISPGGVIAQAQAQAEGETLDGLSLASVEGTEFVNGEVKARTLLISPPLRLADVPALPIRFVARTESATRLETQCSRRLHI